MTKAVLVYQVRGMEDIKIEKYESVGECNRQVSIMFELNNKYDEPLFNGIMWNEYNQTA